MLPQENLNCLHVKNAALFCILAVCIITDTVTAKLEGVFLVTPSLQPIFFSRLPKKPYFFRAPHPLKSHHSPLPDKKMNGL